MQTEPSATTSEDSHSMTPNDTMLETIPYPDFTQIPAVRYVFVAVYLVVMVLAVIGNAMVCCTVFTNRKMHTAVNYYIVNLAICDFMVGIFVLPVKLMELTSPAHWGILNDELCTTFMYLQTIFVFASVLTLVAICIERPAWFVHTNETDRRDFSKGTIKKAVKDVILKRKKNYLLCCQSLQFNKVCASEKSKNSKRPI